MVIRVLHTEWSEGWGGQEIRIINEMKALRAYGVEVFLACRDHALIKQKAIENNIQVFVLPFKGNADFITIFMLAYIIKKHSIDIVNTHSGKDTWVGGLAAKLAGVRFIRTRHLSNPIKASRLNFINELADYIFTTGESIKSNMIRYNRINPEKIESIPTGVDDNLFNPIKYKRSECKKLFKIHQGYIAIGIIAVLRQFKRHDLFLRMAKKIIQTYPNKKFVFIIAGDGPQKENIISWVEDLGLSNNVILLGHVDQVAELLTALDFIVLSSDSKEGVPQSVIQSLMMNKAVVSSNSGSTEDLFYRDNFELVKTRSANALFDGLTNLIKKDKEINSRNFIVSNFSLEVMARKILSIYKGLI